MQVHHLSVHKATQQLNLDNVSLVKKDKNCVHRLRIHQSLISSLIRRQMGFLCSLRFFKPHIQNQLLLRIVRAVICVLEASYY